MQIFVEVVDFTRYSILGPHNTNGTYGSKTLKGIPNFIVDT